MCTKGHKPGEIVVVVMLEFHAEEPTKRFALGGVPVSYPFTLFGRSSISPVQKRRLWDVFRTSALLRGFSGTGERPVPL